MSIQDCVKNELIQDESSVWCLKKHSAFGYSDGVESERYLEKVFKSVDDLSSTSSELETYIKDWPSEYHLTVNRAQLFSGFDFDSSLKVLEVGCGCGAITRFLGEKFEDVISIEGSLNRARLAKLRTKNLDSVSIICAPFQEIEFNKKFDIIFCVGVYEYSASFVSGDTPYDTVLRYFDDMLTADGIVVIAIENQFGLKYFSSASEDHTGVMFEGIEGYHAQENKVKTFGKQELEENLKKYFSNIEFYYPYPDYKIPSCIISDCFLKSGSAGELVSQIKTRDYIGRGRVLWNDSAASLELSKNGMLPFFSNSFLVFASKSEIKSVSFKQLAIISSSQRAKKFRTQTRIYSEDGEVVVSKKTLSGDEKITDNKLTLIEAKSKWNASFSLQTEVYKKCLSKEKNIKSMFEPCCAWVNFLLSKSSGRSNTKYLSGEYVDCIWSNFYFRSSEVSIIDKEWVWKDDLKLNVLVIRGIYTFLDRVESAKHISVLLKVRNLKKLIKTIATSIGITLSNEDFSDFVKLETEFQFLVSGSRSGYSKAKLKWLLFDRQSYFFVRNVSKLFNKIYLRVRKIVISIY